MPGRPQTTPEQEARIATLAFEGRNATQIHHRIGKEGLRSEPHPDISIRTVQDRVRKLRPQDPSGRWSFADVDVIPEDARLILDVLAEVEERTKGRVEITRGLAEWIVRVGAVAQSMHPWDIYVFASQYRARMAQDQDTSDLDRMLAFRTWEGREAMGRFLRSMRNDTAEAIARLPEMLYAGPAAEDDSDD